MILYFKRFQNLALTAFLLYGLSSSVVFSQECPIQKMGGQIEKRKDTLILVMNRDSLSEILWHLQIPESRKAEFEHFVGAWVIVEAKVCKPQLLTGVQEIIPESIQYFAP